MLTLIRKTSALLLMLTLCGASPAIAQDSDLTDEEFREKLSQTNERIDESIKIIRQQITENQSAPFLADLYLQLAEFLIQKSNTLFFIQMEKENKTEVTITPDDKQYDFVLESTRESIGILERIAKEFPKYNRRDKVFYLLILAYQSLDETRKGLPYLKLLEKEFPKSEGWTKSKLLFGQYYFKKNELKKAASHFNSVVRSKFVYEKNVARYRLGLIAIRQDKHKKALKLFEKVITDDQLKAEEAPREISLKRKSVKKDLKREALIDSIRAYTNVYKRNPKPLQYYSKIAPSELHFHEIIEKLAYRYISIKKHAVAVRLLRAFSERIGNPEKVINIYRDVLTKISVKDRLTIPVSEMAYVVDKYYAWKTTNEIPRKIERQTENFFETQVRELATKSHDLAKAEKKRVKVSLRKAKKTVKSVKIKKLKKKEKVKKKRKVTKKKKFKGKKKKKKGKKERNKRKKGKKRSSIEAPIEDIIEISQAAPKQRKLERVLERAENYYLLYLGTFQKSKNRSKMATNLADVYFLSEKYLESGEFYLRIFLGEYGKNSKRTRKKILKNALLALQKEVDYDYYDQLRARGLLMRAIEEYFQFEPIQRNNAKLNFVLAKAKYDQAFFEEAIPDLYKFMKKFKRSRLAVDAGDLILDYYNLRENYAKIIEWSEKFLALKLPHGKFNRRVKQIRSQVRVRRLKEIVKASDYDEFSQGKGYLEYALEGDDPALRDAAIQEALRASKREQDIETFFKSTAQLIKAEKSKKKRNQMVASLGYEKANITMYYGAIQSFKKSGTTSGLEAAVNTALLLKDWNKLASLMGSPRFKKISSSTKSRIRQQLVDLVESPAEIPSSLRQRVFSVKPDASLMLALYKSGNKQARKKVRAQCKRNVNTPLCRWHYVSQVDRSKDKFLRQLSRSTTKVNVLERLSVKQRTLAAQYEAVLGSGDPHLDTIVSLRLHELFDAFSQYLGQVARSNKQFARILGQNAKESQKRSKSYLRNCTTIAKKSPVVFPAASRCKNGSSESIFELSDWDESVSVELDSSDPDPADYEGLQKALFVNDKSADPLLKLAYQYYQDGFYRHASAAAYTGASKFQGDSGDFHAVLGCSVSSLGLYSEARYYLLKASDYKGIKKDCLGDLNAR